MSEPLGLHWSDSPVAASANDPQVDDLIAACLRGDAHAYDELYDRFAGSLFRLAYGLLQHEEDAEEVLQDSFEYAFRRLEHYDARKASFKTWLFRITVSRCRNKRRRKWLPSLSLHSLADSEARDPGATLPDERVARNERDRAVWAALGELSPKLREVAILRHYAGMPYAEIGAVLGIPSKTAESRMRLAHKALREQLSDIVT